MYVNILLYIYIYIKKKKIYMNILLYIYINIKKKKNERNLTFISFIIVMSVGSTVMTFFHLIGGILGISLYG